MDGGFFGNYSEKRKDKKQKELEKKPDSCYPDNKK